MGARTRADKAEPTEETPAPQPRVNQAVSPTAHLGWEARVELRLDRLEGTVGATREDVAELAGLVRAVLERPSTLDRCLAGMGGILQILAERLTAPDALRWTAVIILGLVALLTGASLSGWGVSIGGATSVGISQPALLPQGPEQ